MTKNDRSLIVCACMIAIGSVAYVVDSAISHNDNNLQCTCILCTNNHIPKDGEYLYNHYLFVLSVIWIAFMVILGYVVKERIERNTRKINKNRNR